MYICSISYTRNLGIFVYIKDLQEEDCSCSQQFKIVKFLKPSTLVLPVY